MVNSVYGKYMKNPIKRMDIKLGRSGKMTCLYIIKHNLKDYIFISIIWRFTWL